MEQRGEERGAFNVLELFWTKGWSAMNEWLMVRREESGIYTPRQNLTVQIYIGSPDTDLWNIQRQGNEEL